MNEEKSWGTEMQQTHSLDHFHTINTIMIQIIKSFCILNDKRYYSLNEYRLKCSKLMVRPVPSVHLSVIRHSRFSIVHLDFYHLSASYIILIWIGAFVCVVPLWDTK